MFLQVFKKIPSYINVIMKIRKDGWLIILILFMVSSIFSVPRLWTTLSFKKKKKKKKKKKTSSWCLGWVEKCSGFRKPHKFTLSTVRPGGKATLYKIDLFEYRNEKNIWLTEINYNKVI